MERLVLVVEQQLASSMRPPKGSSMPCPKLRWIRLLSALTWTCSRSSKHVPNNLQNFTNQKTKTSLKNFFFASVLLLYCFCHSHQRLPFKTCYNCVIFKLLYIKFLHTLAVPTHPNQLYNIELFYCKHKVSYYSSQF